jgi:RecB family exonuclease
MTAVARAPFGRIILSGKISGRYDDFKLPTNPYHSEYMFLSRLGYDINDIVTIDVGKSDTIDFMNYAFGNNPQKTIQQTDISHCHIIECEREWVEAVAVAEIVSNAITQKKSVLIITPDAAGNQRIASELSARGICADFSAGRPATMHEIGRAILNTFDDWIENHSTLFDELYKSNDKDLFKTILYMVESGEIKWDPEFNPIDDDAISIWVAIRDLSNALLDNGIELSLSDVRAFIADTLSSVTIRPTPSDNPDVCVLGTIESRMQTADVVILTGLNDGMFPARGYENAWLPRTISDQIGLPSPDHKVSLMALDFMNLSCGNEVYWLRSKISGGVQTIESRFLSRVSARNGNFDTTIQDKILSCVYAHDNVPARPLNYDAPTPPSDWSDIYVTDLELLIHNPYSFYVRHILRLKQIDDYWIGPDARKFGNLVHDVIEHAKPGDTPETLIARMDDSAKKIPALSGVLFRFWHKRFTEIAPFISNELMAHPYAHAEISGFVKIKNRTIRARADRICDGIVMDIKTGAAPTKAQLMDGTMPQLPLEAYMLQSGGFEIPITDRSKNPTMMFLQLRNNNVTRIEYDAATTATMIRAAVNKTTDIIEMFSIGRAPYENRPNSDPKYKQFDDLARTRDDF